MANSINATDQNSTPSNPAPVANPHDKQPRRIRSLFRTLFPSQKDIKTHKQSLWMVLASALFGGLIFHHNTLGVLGWVALIPLFIALHDLRGKLLFWATLFFGFTWYYLGVYWLHTLVVFHWLIPLGVLVGSLYVGLYFVLFAFPAAWCCRHVNPALRPWAIAVCWTAVEYLRNFTEMAFPWNLLGHSQAPWNIWHMQLAQYGGVSLISFLMALINATAAVLIVSMRRPLSAMLATSTIAILPLLLFAGLTLQGASYPTCTLWGKHIPVSVIQPGVSQLQRWHAMMGTPEDTDQSYQQRWLETESLMLERVATLTREAAQEQPALIVMPESIFMTPRFPFATQLQHDLIALSKETGAHLFFGADNLLDRVAYEEEMTAGRQFLRYGETPKPFEMQTLPLLQNDDATTTVDIEAVQRLIPTVAAWHISPHTGIENAVYNKMRLVPFGEQVPFLQGFQWLQNKFELAGIAGAYRPGLQNTLFNLTTQPISGLGQEKETTQTFQFGTVICFESTFSELTRELTLGGANFLCVITNDSWYDPNYAISEGGFWGTLFHLPGIKQLASAGPKQHLVQSQFRAIETGRFLIRSANTGISAIIHPLGQLTTSIEYGTSGHFTAYVPPISLDPTLTHETLFVRYGEWLGKLCLGIWTALVCLLILARPKTSGKRFALHK